MQGEATGRPVGEDTVRVFIDLCYTLNRTPTQQEIRNAVFNMLGKKRTFDTIACVAKLARKIDPNFAAWQDSKINEDNFDPKSLYGLKDYDSYIVCSATMGSPVSKDFYRALERYAKEHNAKIVVLPIEDPSKKIKCIDPFLETKDIAFAFKEIKLGGSWKISSIKLSAKQIDPSTGLLRASKKLAAGREFVVVASPKQRLRMVADSSDHKGGVVCPGSLTESFYLKGEERYSSRRISYIADLDHKVGALVLHRRGNGFVNRFITWDGTQFIDLDKSYKASGVSKAPRPEAMVLGDIHAASVCEKALKKCIEQIKELKPKRIMLHDLFCGVSVNHHEADNKITNAMVLKKRTMDLEKELKITLGILERIATAVPNTEVIVVKSNHDLWLKRYIDKLTFQYHPQNLPICIRIAYFMLTEERDSLEIGLNLTGKGVPKNVQFLSEKDSVKICGVELGRHGHTYRGINMTENMLRSAIVGHSHTPQILRDVIVVGTNSRLDLPYLKSETSWSHTNAALYPNGMSQLITLINHKHWR